MKKPIWIAFGYAIAAMACGVFYREFTKFFDFTVHNHLGGIPMYIYLCWAQLYFWQ